VKKAPKRTINALSGAREANFEGFLHFLYLTFWLKLKRKPVSISLENEKLLNS